MTKRSDKNMLIGLDIGTSKVVAIVGEVTSEGEIEIIGLGSNPSNGLKKGVVVNIESTVQSIQRAIEEAELMAGCQISSVNAGIAGSHIRSLNSHGIVAIREREVTDGDLDRVIDAARAVAIPADQRVLHILPQEFIIDDQEGIREPVGMSGVRLEAKVHLVTGAVGAAQNIIKCIRRCGLEVDDIILEQLASSYSVLTEDEKELGVCLVDIGGGTTEIGVTSLGGLVISKSIRVAGDNFDQAIIDYIKKNFNLLIGDRVAEELKIKIGTAIPLDEELTTTVRGRDQVEGTLTAIEITSEHIRSAMKDSLEEIADALKAVLEQTPPELAGDIVENGIVLTGGGALIRGLDKYLSDIVKLPVYIAEDPLLAVAKGTGKALDELDLLQQMAYED